MNANNNLSLSEYPSYPKRFSPYKWYKPLLVLLLAGAFYLVFSTIISIIGGVAASFQGYDITSIVTGGYKNFDAYSAPGALMSLGNIAAFIPSILIANRIVNARPFSSYSSAMGGFRFAEFFKSFGAALILVALPIGIYTFAASPNTGNVKFTVAGFIICAVLSPLQCIAEEYMFRGLIMQTFGSWIKFPIIPIIIQTALFAALHPYNSWGVIAVAFMGLILGFCACITKGLEAGCALHIANNMTAFFITGFGIGGITSEVSFLDFLIPAICCLLYFGFIILAIKKFGWFGKAKKDDVAEFNAKIEAKNAHKAA